MKKSKKKSRKKETGKKKKSAKKKLLKKPIKHTRKKREPRFNKWYFHAEFQESLTADYQGKKAGRKSIVNLRRYNIPTKSITLKSFKEKILPMIMDYEKAEFDKITARTMGNKVFSFLRYVKIAPQEEIDLKDKENDE